MNLQILSNKKQLYGFTLVTAFVILTSLTMLYLRSDINDNFLKQFYITPITLTSFIFFMLSFGIAVISVIAGIGGGVLFTPIMLAFTNIDSLVVRSTGLIVAMFSGLISSGPLMKSGIANLKITIVLALSFSIGALLGANAAIFTNQNMGQFGDSLIRLLLSILVAGVGLYFLIGAKKIEWPQNITKCSIAKYLDLHLPYHEKSTGNLVQYGIKNTAKGVSLISFVGFISGMFGLGGGWAISPIQNLIMGLPLKVALANSGVLIGMGDCVAIWPYINQGAIIPTFAAPWLLGQVFGGILGAKILSNVKISYIRYILIAILFFTSFSLFVSSLVRLGIIQTLSSKIYLTAFIICTAFAFTFIKRDWQAKNLNNNFKNLDDPLQSPDKLAIPDAQIIYGRIVYWLTLSSALIVAIGMAISLISSDDEYSRYSASYLPTQTMVDEKISHSAESEFHFSKISPLLLGANIIMFGIIIGVSSSGIALIFSAWKYLSQKDCFFACASIFIISLMILSATNILKIK